MPRDAVLSLSAPALAAVASPRLVRMSALTFESQLRGVRQGDLAATDGFVRTYRPFVTAQARRVLRANPLHRICDESDIGQSVLTRVVAGLQRGEFQIEGEPHLHHLLRTMAWNKVVSIARRERARGGPPVESPLAGEDSDLWHRLAVSREASPSELVASQDFLNTVRSRLVPTLAGVLDRWLEGYLWDEIGAELNQRGHTIRVRFRRELKRVLESLQLPPGQLPADELSADKLSAGQTAPGQHPGQLPGHDPSARTAPREADQ